MRVLYCNPSFWDYRLPFYKRLKDLYNGDFFVTYSPVRYKVDHESLLVRIKDELGDNAVPYENELMYDVHTHSFNHFSENYRQIPIPIRLLSIVHKIKPDVLISEGFFQWTPWVIIYSIIHNVPLFIGYERTLHTERNASKLQTWYRKIVNKFVAGYLVNGNATRRYLLSIGVNDKKIHIGGMCADSDGLRARIAAMDEAEKLMLKAKYKKNDGLIYLFTGKLIERKGIDHLLHVWKEHIKKYPNDSLIVVGNGDLYDDCISKYSQISSVFFEGAVLYSDIYRFYAIADVYVMPTIEDNWSLVVPEAMSCGLPVATSIYNGCHEELIENGGNGYIFDTFNHEEFAEVLAKFHNVDLVKMGNRSVELEKPYNIDNCTQRVYDALNKYSINYHNA